MFKQKTMVLAAAVLAVAVVGCAVPAFASYRSVGYVNGWLGTGDWEWIGADLYSGRQYKITLSVPWSADFDVKVYYDKNRNGIAESSELIAKGTRGTGLDESFTFVPRYTGRYHIKVYSYSGSGFYTLRLYKWV